MIRHLFGGSLIVGRGVHPGPGLKGSIVVLGPRPRLAAKPQCACVRTGEEEQGFMML